MTKTKISLVADSENTRFNNLLLSLNYSLYSIDNYIDIMLDFIPSNLEKASKIFTNDIQVNMFSTSIIQMTMYFTIENYVSVVKSRKAQQITKLRKPRKNVVCLSSRKIGMNNILG